LILAEARGAVGQTLGWRVERLGLNRSPGTIGSKPSSDSPKHLAPRSTGLGGHDRESVSWLMLNPDSRITFSQRGVDRRPPQGSSRRVPAGRAGCIQG
jgi:hypothetical protein